MRNYEIELTEKEADMMIEKLKSENNQLKLSIEKLEKRKTGIYALELDNQINDYSAEYKKNDRVLKKFLTARGLKQYFNYPTATVSLDLNMEISQISFHEEAQVVTFYDCVLSEMEIEHYIEIGYAETIKD